MQEIQKELKMISELMDELQEKMSYDSEDFESRLGRKKPEVEMVKIEGKVPGMEGMESEEMEMEPDESPSMHDMLGEMESPEDKLKKRLMKLRG